MLLDVATGGTMRVVDAEHVTKIIDLLESTNYQAQNDRQIEPKKGILIHNTSDAILA